MWVCIGVDRRRACRGERLRKSFSSCPSTLGIRDKRTGFSCRRCRLSVLAQDAGRHTERRKDARCVRSQSCLIRNFAAAILSQLQVVVMLSTYCKANHPCLRRSERFCNCVIVKYRKAIRLLMGLCRQVNSPVRKSRRQISGTYISLLCRRGPVRNSLGRSRILGGRNRLIPFLSSTFRRISAHKFQKNLT